MPAAGDRAHHPPARAARSALREAAAQERGEEASPRVNWPSTALPAQRQRSLLRSIFGLAQAWRQLRVSALGTCGQGWEAAGAAGAGARLPRPAPASRPGGGASPLLRRLPAFANTGAKDFAPSSKAPSHAGGGGRWGGRCGCSSRPAPRSPLPCCCQIRSPLSLSASPGSGTLQKALLPADKLAGGPSASWVSRLAAEQDSWLTAALRLGRSQLTVVCSPGSPLQQAGPMRSCTSEAAELQGLTASGSAPRAAPLPRPACTPPLGSREFHLPALRACVL